MMLWIEVVSETLAYFTSRMEFVALDSYSLAYRMPDLLLCR